MRIGRATVACLPGVPHEMKRMFQEQVVPRLRQNGWISRVTVHRKINLFGKGESEIEAQAMDLTARGRVPEVGITAHDSTISFRISASGTTEEEARRLIEPTAKLIYERFGSLVVGEGTDDVPEATVAQLAAHDATLATAESCTGGVVAQMITAIAGVSPYYLGGAVSYANLAKIELLGVPAALIETHGAVSPEVAAAMAEGVRNRLGADLGLSHHRSRRSLRRITGKTGRARLSRYWQRRKERRRAGSISALISRATSSSGEHRRPPSTGCG